jgi:cytochrome c-type biogenesis protein CcmH
VIRRGLAALALTAVLLTATGAWAVQPDEMLEDPAAEARARALSAEIRCLVCQNQSIDDSDADLARDLRLLVREKIEEGRSDDQIRDFLVERYGAFVLLDPPMQTSTLLLWFGPLAVLVLGAIGLAVYYRSRTRAPAGGDTLTAEERARIERLLDAQDAGGRHETARNETGGDGETRA